MHETAEPWVKGLIKQLKYNLWKSGKLYENIPEELKFRAQQLNSTKNHTLNDYKQFVNQLL